MTVQTRMNHLSPADSRKLFTFVTGVDFSCFVGDLAPDVTDYVLQEHFRAQYPAVRSAKASLFIQL